MNVCFLLAGLTLYRALALMPAVIDTKARAGLNLSA